MRVLKLGTSTSTRNLSTSSSASRTLPYNSGRGECKRMTRPERRVVKSISGKSGVLTDKTGAALEVRFSLTPWQDYVDDIPTLKSAAGSIEFKDARQAWSAMGGKLSTLIGGGIQADVYVDTMSTFKVTGPV